MLVRSVRPHRRTPVRGRVGTRLGTRVGRFRSIDFVFICVNYLFARQGATPFCEGRFGGLPGACFGQVE